MKWYSFDTGYEGSLVRSLSRFLKSKGFKFKISDKSVPGNPTCHFEIYTDDKGVDVINSWLDENTLEDY